MFVRLKHWWRQHLVFDLEQRALLYETLAAQLASGLPPQRAFEGLCQFAQITPVISKVAATAAAAGREGRLLTEGLAESGYIPPVEVGILQIAERNNRLQSACEGLQNQAKERLSFVSVVVLPNSYYLFILMVLLFMAYQAEELIQAIGHGSDSVHVPAYQLSLLLKGWAMPIASGLALVILTIVFGRSFLTGLTRRILGFFDLEYRSLLAIRFADMASVLSTEGATHRDILDAAQLAFGHEAYVRWAVAEARQRHLGDGETIEDSLADTLLTGSLSSLLSALTPGREQEAYPAAYEALGRIQRVRLRTQYRWIAAGFRMLLLASIALLLLTLMHGVYTVLSKF